MNDKAMEEFSKLPRRKQKQLLHKKLVENERRLYHRMKANPEDQAAQWMWQYAYLSLLYENPCFNESPEFCRDFGLPAPHTPEWYQIYH